MYEIFADLHVHIGRSESGKPIKITAARTLNFANIAKECESRKGIQVVGIIDCASPYVIEDIENFLKNGEAYELKDGGIIYKSLFSSILDEVEGIGEARKKKLLNHFKSVKKMKEASLEELEAVIPKNTAAKLYEVLHKE